MFWSYLCFLSLCCLLMPLRHWTAKTKILLLSEPCLMRQISDESFLQISYQQVGLVGKSPTELVGNFPEDHKNIKYDWRGTPIRTVPLIRWVTSNQTINLKKTEANLKKKVTWKTIPLLPARRGASSTSTPPRWHGSSSPSKTSTSIWTSTVSSCSFNS